MLSECAGSGRLGGLAVRVGLRRLGAPALRGTPARSTGRLALRISYAALRCSLSVRATSAYSAMCSDVSRAISDRTRVSSARSRSCLTGGPGP